MVKFVLCVLVLFPGDPTKMIIFLSELQKDHLQLLSQHSTQVLVEFCKLAIEYLHNGLNDKKCGVAAAKLNASTAEIENVIYALVFLLIEGCKHDLSEADFKSSLALAGFSGEQQEVLAKLYDSRKADICDCLHLLRQRDPMYQDLKWRFEIQVCSKNGSQNVKPSVAMDFILTTPKNFNESKSTGKLSSKPSDNKLASYTVNNPTEDAKTASQCLNIIDHVVLQCDLPNLLNMTNKLEQALKESKCQHVRKVQRALH